jgi:serine/threonine protein kinase
MLGRKRNLETGQLDHTLYLILYRLSSQVSSKGQTRCDVRTLMNSSQSIQHCLRYGFMTYFSALVHCHTNGVILRAIQPDQIFVDHSGVLKLAGYYRATVLPQNERDVCINLLKITKKRREKSDDTDDLIVTTPYSAPELLLRSLKHTKETDIWGVGSMLSHRLPLFLGKERSSLLWFMYRIVGQGTKKV